MASQVLQWARKHYGKFFACAFAYGVSVSPGTVFLPQYRWFTEAFQPRPRREIHPDDKLNDIIDQVKKDLKFEEDKLDKIQFYVISTPEPLHKGGFSSINGGLVGVPLQFMYTSTDCVAKSDLFLKAGTIFRSNNVHLDQNSADGRIIQYSYILSDDLQKFAIMKEVMACRSNTDHVTSCIGLGVFISCISGFMLFCNHVLFIGAPTTSWAGLFAVGGLLLFYNIKDRYERYYEQKTDKMVAAFGKGYAEAGLKYYKICQSRNLACRRLLGEKDGHRLYYANGNVTHWLFRSKMSLTSHIDTMTEALSKYSI